MSGRQWAILAALCVVGLSIWYWESSPAVDMFAGAPQCPVNALPMIENNLENAPSGHVTGNTGCYYLEGGPLVVPYSVVSLDAGGAVLIFKRPHSGWPTREIGFTGEGAPDPEVAISVAGAPRKIQGAQLHFVNHAPKRIWVPCPHIGSGGSHIGTPSPSVPQNLNPDLVNHYPDDLSCQ